MFPRDQVPKPKRCSKVVAEFSDCLEAKLYLGLSDLGHGYTHHHVIIACPFVQPLPMLRIHIVCSSALLHIWL